MLLLDCSVTLLLEATTLEEDCFTSSLLLDLASEEEGFTEELDSFAFSSDELDFSSFLEEEEEEACLPSLEEDFDFSTEEEDLSLLEFFCELEDSSPLEAGMTDDEESSDGSGETEEEESSPHAAKTHAKTSANIRRVIVDCFATLAMTFEKIFTEDLQI